MSQSSQQRPTNEDGPWPPPSIRSTQPSHHDQPAATLKSGDVEADLSTVLVQQDANTRPKCFRNLFEEIIFIFTVMMAVSCTSFLQGVTVINTATIGRSLHMSPAEVTWISAAIGLGSGSFMLMFGKTADLFGCKPQLVVGMVWLAAWSLGTAFAPDAIPMNVFCGMLGVGTALISPAAIGAMFATYAEGRRRNLATGALGSANPIGFIFGSMSSGVMTKYFNWRASFIFLAIYFFVATLLAIWTMPSIPRHGSVKDNVRRFDYFGTLLTIFGIGLISFALTEGPQNGWNSAHFIASLIIGIACVVCFIFWENVYTDPLLNPIVWKNRNFTLCVLAVMFGYGSFATSQFWISLYLQKIQRLSGIHIAVQLLTQAISGIVWSYLGQYLVSKVYGTILMGIGGLGYFVGTLLLTFVDIDTPYWRFLFPSLIITVIGADFQFIVSNLFVNKHMSDQASLGAGVLQTAMRLSISLGLAISTAVFGAVQESQPPDTMLTDPRTSLPYHRALLCASLFAAVGLLFIPFMRIDIKSSISPAALVITPTSVVDPEPTVHSLDPSDEIRQPEKDGEKAPEESHTPHDKDTVRQESEYSSNCYDTPKSSFQSAAAHTSVSRFTGKSEVSFFPRWSWETDAFPDDDTSSGPCRPTDAEVGGGQHHQHQPEQEKKGKLPGMKEMKDMSDDCLRRFEEEKVYHEVCINCLQERRVMVRLGGGDRENGSGRRNSGARDVKHDRQYQARIERLRSALAEWI